MKRKYSDQHKEMVVWVSVEQLKQLVTEILETIDKFEFKTKSQIVNACDSISSNFVEGYYSGSTKEYRRFLRYARRSAAELLDRVENVYQRNRFNRDLFERFEDRAIKTMYLIDRTIGGLEKKINSRNS
jgi:four helix bundle protein